MGPIAITMKHGNLTDDWYESSTSTVDDYKVSQSFVGESQVVIDQVCINENWITQAPNILFFTINRLAYDIKK